MQVDYTVHIWKEGDQYVAHAMPLDVASSGATADAARAAVHEAVQLFLGTAADAGTLDEVLEEAGYTRREHQWERPDWIAVEHRAATVGA